MTRDEYDEAHKMAVKLVDGLHAIHHEQKASGVKPLLMTATKLRNMLEPPPTMREVLERVPGETLGERAVTIGISRQHYYNLERGIARHSAAVAKRLAELTGISESVIREIW